MIKNNYASAKLFEPLHQWSVIAFLHFGYPQCKPAQRCLFLPFDWAQGIIKRRVRINTNQVNGVIKNGVQLIKKDLGTENN
jgi:hypothetical protein